MSFDQVLQYVFSGITIGSIYAIVAIGFNIIYNTTGIINFSQGEFVMLGGMISYSLCRIMPLFAAIILAVIITALIGSAIEFLFIRGLSKRSVIGSNIISAGLTVLLISIVLHKVELPLLYYLLINLAGCAVTAVIVTSVLLFTKKGKAFLQNAKKPNVLQMIIITIGLSIIIREIALHVWDEKVRALPFFTGSEVSSINILGANISPQVLWVLGVGAVIVVTLTLFFKFSLTGKAMRACSDSKEAASLCGIKYQTMINLSFALSAAIGALAGCVVSPITQTHYMMGTGLAIRGFTASILGGLGNSIAAVIAGLLLGLIEAFSVSILPSAYQESIATIVLILILFIKPSGIFGSKEISKLKDY